MSSIAPSSCRARRRATVIALWFSAAYATGGVASIGSAAQGSAAVSSATTQSAPEHAGAAAPTTPTRSPLDEASAPPSRALLYELTQQTRLAGTIGSKVAAEHVAKHLRDAGFEVEFDDREVLLSLPRRIELDVFDEGVDAEPIHRRSERFDPDAIPPGDVPLCNGWSASGEVRAPVVDVGRGLRADFERLRAAGVDVEGKIALARYGGAYRGIKVDLAAQYGCAAVLLFHERRKDGEAWPYGPWKHGYDGERGSISPMGRIPGDPSTPGWPSPHPGESARRLEGDELASALPRIPCIPIGWAEAELLLDRLAPRPDVDARGAAILDADGKPVTRPIGPGPVEARLLVDQPRDVRTIRNVIATLKGQSDDCVIAGNHRDAWVRGANDAGSGTVAMLRAAQHLGRRVRDGWKPPHTIRLCFWDAEEFGLIGSTEWGEANADYVRQHAFAYVNADVGVSGTMFRGVDGTPGLLGTLCAALERVPTGTPGTESRPRTLLTGWDDFLAGKPREIGLAGSGSDFAVFLHHLSVPTLDIGLGGNSSGQYHTNFDDFAIVDRYVDPGFVGHELAGHLLDELLFEFSQRGRASFDAFEAARTLAAECRQESTKDKDRWLPAPMAMKISGALARLAQACEGASTRSTPIYRRLEDEQGVPGRAWYRNVLWTPGLETGYSSELFPTLRAAVGDEHAFTSAVDALVARIERVAASVAVSAPATSAPATSAQATSAPGGSAQSGSAPATSTLAASAPATSATGGAPR